MGSVASWFVCPCAMRLSGHFCLLGQRRRIVYSRGFGGWLCWLFAKSFSNRVLFRAESCHSRGRALRCALWPYVERGEMSSSHLLLVVHAVGDFTACSVWCLAIIPAWFQCALRCLRTHCLFPRSVIISSAFWVAQLRLAMCRRLAGCCS